MKPSIVADLARVADSEAPREQRARAAAEMIRTARGYRWVGIYDVGDDEIAAIGYSGSRPARETFSITQGLGGEAVRTRRTVAAAVSKTIVADPRRGERARHRRARRRKRTRRRVGARRRRVLRRLCGVASAALRPGLVRDSATWSSISRPCATLQRNRRAESNWLRRGGRRRTDAGVDRRHVWRLVELGGVRGREYRRAARRRAGWFCDDRSKGLAVLLAAGVSARTRRRHLRPIRRRAGGTGTSAASGERCRRGR